MKYLKKAISNFVDFFFLRLRLMRPYLLQSIDLLLLGVKGHQGVLMLYLQLLLQLDGLMHMLLRNREQERTCSHRGM